MRRESRWPAVRQACTALARRSIPLFPLFPPVQLPTFLSRIQPSGNSIYEMNDWPDMRLLREYAERGTEQAFTVLVSRHLAMVYQAAFRQTRQVQLAEEIAQTVFTLLAKKADRISGNTLLTGWLFNTARFVSARAVRDERRRQHRQAEAARMNLDSPEPIAPAEQALPYLDEMLARLPNRDRQAVLLRYFDGQSFQQVGLAVGLTEEAAKKRVQRALEKMRAMLGARGVVLGVATLGAAFEAAKAQALPPGLSAAALSSAALKGASGAAAVSALTRSTLELMRWTKIKVIGATALGIVVGIGTTTHFLNRNAPATAAAVQAAATPATPDPAAALQDTADRLRLENARLAATLAAANARKAQLVAARQAAEHVTQESKEIASRNLAPTNGPASMRDAFVSLGKLMRLSVLNETNLTAQDRKAARDAASQESLHLLQAAGQLDLFHLDDYTPASPEEAADLTTGMLHGLLDLTPEQFSQVRAALSKYETQAMQADPQNKLTLPEPETILAVQDQIQNLLSEQQREVLQRILQKTTERAAPGPAGTNANAQPPRDTP